jgi:soluble lytic murein transglycosylase-like protein
LILFDCFSPLAITDCADTSQKNSAQSAKITRTKGNDFMRNGAVVFLIIGCCSQAHADIYKKVIGNNGVISYTNKAPTVAEKPLIKTVARSNTATTGYFYKYQDSAKHVIYTDKPRMDVALVSKMKVTVPAKNVLSQLVFTSPYMPTPASFYNNPNKTKFNNLIAQAAARHQVDAKLVHAVIQAESAYRPDAISSAGAVGLMQLMPATASRFGVMDINNPEQNINGGTRYLRYLIDLFPNNLDLAIAAYNAGENSVLRHNNSIPPYPETQNYVKQVKAFYVQKSG